MVILGGWVFLMSEVPIYTRNLGLGEVRRRMLGMTVVPRCVSKLS
jgi:hypothetical protein